MSESNPENAFRLCNQIIQSTKFNEPLAMVYYLKDDLRQFWNQQSKSKAKEHLAAWIAKSPCLEDSHANYSGEPVFFSNASLTLAARPFVEKGFWMN